jgi:glycosyltransferase involved in cell wall biosynthesis
MSRTILVNARFSSRPISGVERYAHDLTSCLGDMVALIKPSPLFRGWSGHIWEQLLLPLYVRKSAILWSPANTGPLSTSNQVVTIHDLAPLDCPEWYSPAFASWYGFLLPRLASRTHRVITDSAFSKTRLTKRFGLDNEKVVVVPPGVSGMRFHPASTQQIKKLRERFGLRQPFLLFIGALQPRKNLSRLLQAWVSIKPLFPDLNLLLVGSKSARFGDPGLVDLPVGVRTISRVDEEDLPVLYSAALGVVIPSLYEGSCLTGLESLACGTPVVASNIPAFQEVLSDNACYFDPTSVESMATVLGDFLCSFSKHQDLVDRGYRRAAEFSLERSAELIWKVLNES